MSTGILNSGQPEPEPGRPHDLARRAFILSAAGAVSAVAFWGLRRSTVAEVRPLEPNEGPANVTIVQFSTDGKKTGTIAVPRLIKTDAEWRLQLNQTAYWVTRHADTERPFTGDLLNEHERGLFHCIGCDLSLFSSDTKFDSGTGWPSFWEPIAEENIVKTVDGKLDGGPHRCVVPALRRSSRPCLRRRTTADRDALLHENSAALRFVKVA